MVNTTTRKCKTNSSEEGPIASRTRHETRENDRIERRLKIKRESHHMHCQEYDTQLRHWMQQNEYHVRVTEERTHGPIDGTARNCNMDTFYSGTVLLFKVGNMDVVCDYCGAMGYKAEAYDVKIDGVEYTHFGKMCCNKGKIRLDEYYPYPPALERLFVDDTPRARYFRSNIRMFNS